MINKLAKTLSKSDSSILNKQEVFNFNPQNNVILENTTLRSTFLYSLLFSYFKKYYCFISKPTFTITSEKTIIHLLYYKNPEGKRKSTGWPRIRAMDLRRDKLSNKYQRSLHSSKRNDLKGRGRDEVRSTLTSKKRFLAHKGMLNRSIGSTHRKVNNLGPLYWQLWLQRSRVAREQGRRIKSLLLSELTRKEEVTSWPPLKETDNEISVGRSRIKKNEPVGRKVVRQSSLFIPHLNNLIKLLSDILRTEVELEIVLLKYPYHDSNIFAQFLGFKAKKLTYGKIKNKIIKKIPVSDLRRGPNSETNRSSEEEVKFSVLRTAGEKSRGQSVPRSAAELAALPIKFGVGLGGALSVSRGYLKKDRVQKEGYKRAEVFGLAGYPSSESKNNIGINIIKKSKSKLASISNVNKLRMVGAKKGTINLNVRRRSSKINPEVQTPIASILTGIKVRIAGRLARQRVVPKRTVKTTYKGAISKSNNNLVDSATYTDKNKKGAFSIRVWLSHGIKT